MNKIAHYFKIGGVRFALIQYKPPYLTELCDTLRVLSGDLHTAINAFIFSARHEKLLMLFSCVGVINVNCKVRLINAKSFSMLYNRCLDDLFSLGHMIGELLLKDEFYKNNCNILNGE